MKIVSKFRISLLFGIVIVLLFGTPGIWAAKPTPVPKKTSPTPLQATSKPPEKPTPSPKPVLPDHASLSAWLKEYLQAWTSWSSSKSYMLAWHESDGSQPKELVAWQKMIDAIESQTYFLPKDQIKTEWRASSGPVAGNLTVTSTNQRLPLKTMVNDSMLPKDAKTRLEALIGDPDAFRKATFSLSYHLAHSWQTEWLVTGLSLEIIQDGRKADSPRIVIPIRDTWMIDASSPDRPSGIDDLEIVTIPVSTDASDSFPMTQAKATPPVVTGDRNQRARDLVKGQTGNNAPVATSQPPTAPGKLLMARTETTMRQYWLVMSKAGYTLQEPDAAHARIPVTQVSWIDAIRFCNALSMQQGLIPVYAIQGKRVESDISKNGWRLPTESEWDHAASADQADGKFFEVDPAAFPDLFDKTAWIWSNADGLKPAGLKKANSFGLCDMYGNAAEWCQDWYSRKDTKANGGSFGEGQDKLIKGGSWMSPPEDLRMGARRSMSPRDSSQFVGFRIVRMQGPQIAPAVETKKKTKS